jgi:putative transposase
MRPKREVATNNGQTYFVTSNTAQRKPFFRHARWAELLIETFYGYRPERFLIHGFVVMPDHFHLLMTPQETLERAVQCVKGRFSFRAKKELGWNGDVWLAGFSDHRIRDLEDYEVHQRYIAKNPVEDRLVERAEDYTYCSANRQFELDAFPQGLKPQVVGSVGGAAKAAPFQSTAAQGTAAGVFSKQISGGVEAPSLQSSTIFLRN